MIALLKALRNSFSEWAEKHNPDTQDRILKKHINQTRLLSGRRFANEKELLTEAVKLYNNYLAYGMNPGDVEEMGRYFAQFGLPKRCDKKHVEDLKIKPDSKSNLHGAEARDWWRGNRTNDITVTAEALGLEVKQLTPYQFRVAGKVDFYPTNGRVHYLKENKRGGYHTAADVKRILEKL